MLWFCSWPDRSSFLVDCARRERAIEIAKTEAGEGVPPSLVRPLPEGVFRAEVVDVRDADLVTVDVDPGTLFVLSEFEDTSEALAGPPCKAEATGSGGGPIVCALQKGHAGEHDSDPGGEDGEVWA
jgi:hypothetical protein